MSRVFHDWGTYLLSGQSAQGSGTPIIDLRATNGKFYRYLSASANGPSASASAVYNLLHSHDKTAWTILETVTAQKGDESTRWFSDGAYGYLMAEVPKVYSAAQSGTASLWVFVRPGVI